MIFLKKEKIIKFCYFILFYFYEFLQTSRINEFTKMRDELTEYYGKETSANIIETPKKGLFLFRYF